MPSQTPQTPSWQLVRRHDRPQARPSAASAGLVTRGLYALLLALTLLGLHAQPAQAQEEPPVEPLRLVVMTIPGKGTKLLAQTLATLPSVELYPEAWFFEQVKKRAYSTRTILSKPNDLRWVMGGAKIDLVIDFAKKRRSNTLKVMLYKAPEGTLARSFELELDPAEGLLQEHADQITAAAEDLLAERIAQLTPAPPPTLVQTPPQETTPTPEDELTTQLPQDPLPERTRAASWLWVSGHGRLIRRDLSVSSRNGVVLNYKSVFYPGYELMVDAIPAPGLPLGLYGAFTHGFDRVVFTDDAGQEQRLPLTHLQVEAGLGYARQDADLTLRARVGARWSSFGLDANPVLPSTSQTSILLQGVLEYTLSIVTLQAQLELVPLSFWGAGADQFGQSPSAYGLGGGLGVLLRATPQLSVPVTYGFHLLNSSFEGQGAARFEEARAFDLAQGLRLGIRYEL